MSTPARKRLMRDFKRLQKDPPAGISGTPTEANIMVRAHTRLHRVGLTRQISEPRPPFKRDAFRPHPAPRFLISRLLTCRPPPFHPRNTAVAGGHLRPRGHPVGGRHVQAQPDIFRRLPQQGARGQVREQDVPPEHIQRRRDLPGHPTEPVVADIRRERHTDVHTEPAVRPQSELPSQFRGGEVIQRVQAGVQQEGAGGGGAVVDRGVTMIVICCWCQGGDSTWCDWTRRGRRL